MEQRDHFTNLITPFEQKGLAVKAHHYQRQDEAVYAVQIGNKDLPVLLLIHGSPGDWTAWKDLILSTNLAEHYQLIIPDRPPYQSSTVEGGDLSSHSKALTDLVQQHCRPCIVAGHSYGGALALQLAIDHRERIAAVVSLSGTIAAPYQSPRWYNYLGDQWWVQKFLSKSMLASNREMMFLSSDLTALENNLKELDLPIYLLQGGEDVLVNPGSPFYLLDLLNSVQVKYNSQWDHFVIWTEKQAVVDLLTGINF